MQADREVTSTVGQLAGLLEAAPSMPILRNHVRVDSREVHRLVAELKETIRARETARRFDPDRALAALIAADDAREAVFNALPVPLTEQVRLPRRKAAELAAALRTVDRL